MPETKTGSAVASSSGGAQRGKMVQGPHITSLGARVILSPFSEVLWLSAATSSLTYVYVWADGEEMSAW